MSEAEAAALHAQTCPGIGLSDIVFAIRRFVLSPNNSKLILAFMNCTVLSFFIDFISKSDVQFFALLNLLFFIKSLSKCTA